MTNRIDTVLGASTKSGHKILSPYITAGDPAPQLTVPLLHALVEGGADILEIGIPFSDPMAEGPVIQKAMERALSHKVNLESVFAMVESFRQMDDKTPIVLMGYLNPIEWYGYEAFAQKAKACGIDGTILVDMPPEEAQEVVSIWKENNLHPILLCSPTTSKNRLDAIAKMGSGYIYYVSLKGVTGAANLALDEVETLYQQRKTQLKLPLMVGFGIKTPQAAANVASFADGVVVGAALIETIYEYWQANKDGVAAAKRLMADMRQAMNALEFKHD